MTAGESKEAPYGQRNEFSQQRSFRAAEPFVSGYPVGGNSEEPSRNRNLMLHYEMSNRRMDIGRSQSCRLHPQQMQQSRAQQQQSVQAYLQAGGS